MKTDIVEKIAEKASNLPVEAQRKALEYVESLEQEVSLGKKPFRSVLGILADRNIHVGEEDIAEMRREAWRRHIAAPHALRYNIAHTASVKSASYTPAMQPSLRKVSDNRRVKISTKTQQHHQISPKHNNGTGDRDWPIH